ncbi:tetratricopeptide repeat protein [Tunicatimonas pelagia]|uniref:tetratricopeptide repeat protein n=1 Tax=Tunicatimonas pelagia TaxID=931531 RepID=UPI0026663329|nr:tetratricopeptide repeat protein [Tunicatimonas pelagia]WKN45067.1 tetratricopeptide repeat protein [Tunicatimonas pelagia]
MKKCYLLLALVLLSHFSVAQYNSKVDSLQAILPTLQGESRVTALRDLCYYLSEMRQEGSLEYGQKAVALAQKLDNPLVLGLAYKDLARALMIADQFGSAVATYDKAIAIFQSRGDQEQMAYIYNNLGNIYKDKSDYDTSLRYLFRSLAIKDSLGGIKLNTAYRSIGETFRMKGNYDKALQYFHRSLEINQQDGNQQGISHDYNSMGVTYEGQGNYEQALKHGLQALEINRELNDLMGCAIAMNNIGTAYYKTKQYDQALKYYHQALAIKEQLKSRKSIAYTNQQLARLYTDLKQYDSALFYANTSRDLFAAINSKEKAAQTYQLLSDIHESQGNYKRALANHQSYVSLKDSVFSIEKEGLIADMEGKYQSAKKDAELLTQQATITKQQTQQRIYLGLAIGLLVLLAGLLFFYRKRQQRNRVLQQLNAQLDAKNHQNELLLKEIHHRVKNNLEMVKSLIALQSAQLEDSATKEAMLASQNRVQSMGIIHQKLYQGDNLGSIEMKDYFINLSEGILDTFNAEDRIKIECAMDYLELDIDTAVPIGLIVNELLTNALKYAFPQDSLGTVNISLARPDDTTLTLTVTDNGVGKTSETSPQGTGFGSQLVQLLTQQLNGHMQEETQDGMRFSFQFNLNYAA